MPSQNPEAPKAPAAARRRFRWLRWFLLLLGLVTGLGFLSLLLLGEILGSAKVRLALVRALQEELNGEVGLEGLSFTWGGGLEITGFRLGNAPGFGDRPAIEFRRAKVGIDLSSLLTGEIDLQILVQDPRVHLLLREDGALNLAALPRWKRISRSKPFSPEEDRPPEPEEDPLEGLCFRIEVRNGLLELEDRRSGLLQRISGLGLLMEKREGPAEVSLGGLIEDGGESRKFHLLATLPGRGRRIRIDLDLGDGLRLDPYGSLLHAILEPGFEEFRGRLKGDITLELPESLLRSPGGAFELSGKFSVRDLALTGGPFGAGKGIRADRWDFRPRMELAFREGGPSIDLEGTRVDLEFLSLDSLDFHEASRLLDPDLSFSWAVGLLARLDLGTLAGKSDLLPEGTWRGRSRIRLALGVEKSLGPGPKPLRFLLRSRSEGIEVRGGFLGEGTELPRDFELEILGEAVQETLDSDTPVFGLRFRLQGDGIHAGGSLGNSRAGKTELDLDSKLTGPALLRLLGALLPGEMKVQGPVEAVLHLEGDLLRRGIPELLRTGGLGFEGRLKARELAYLGNRCENLDQDLKLEGGTLSFRPASKTRLNQGNLELELDLSGLDQPEARPGLSLRLDWDRGRAGFGLTPLLRYVLPFLAGLPTGDLEKLAGLDFESTVQASLRFEGPLPRQGRPLKEVLSTWNGKGKLTLLQGSFTPSPALAGLLRLSGKGGVIRFEDFESDFDLVEGRILTRNSSFGGSEGIVRFSGYTGLDGSLAFNVDITDVLSKHRDGRRLLAMQDHKPVLARIGGSLSSPRVEGGKMLENLLKNGLETGLRDFLEGLSRGRKPGQALKDILKGWKKPIERKE